MSKLVRIRRGSLVLAGALLLGVGASAWAGKTPANGKSADSKKTAAASAVKPGNTSPAEKVRNKRLPWTTLQNAFSRAQLKQRRLLGQIVRLQRALKAAKDAERQKKIKEQLARVQKNFQSLSIAMDVLFAAGPFGRVYVYNPVDSNVYLRIGTLQGAFARAVRVRDRLAQYIGEQQALKDAEKDKKKQEEIQKRIDAASRQWRIIAAALQVVFGIVPQRSYQYDPKSSTLYLMVSDEEVKKLKEQIKQLQKKRTAKNGKARAAKSNPRAGKGAKGKK